MREKQEHLHVYTLKKKASIYKLLCLVSSSPSFFLEIELFSRPTFNIRRGCTRSNQRRNCAFTSKRREKVLYVNLLHYIGMDGWLHQRFLCVREGGKALLCGIEFDDLWRGTLARDRSSGKRGERSITPGGVFRHLFRLLLSTCYTSTNAFLHR